MLIIVLDKGLEIEPQLVVGDIYPEHLLLKAPGEDWSLHLIHTSGMSTASIPTIIGMSGYYCLNPQCEVDKGVSLVLFKPSEPGLLITLRPTRRSDVWFVHVGSTSAMMSRFRPGLGYTVKDQGPLPRYDRLDLF